MNPHAFLQDPQQIKDVESITRVDQQGHLYYMDCSWNYYNLPPQFVVFFDAGCSAFVSKNLNDEFVFYRNYDYGHRYMANKENPIDGLNIIVNCHNPLARFKSIGVADGYWLDWKNGSIVSKAPEDGKTDLSLFAALPYLCMDGINEAGLALSVLALPLETEWEEIDFDSCLQRKQKPEDEVYELTEAGKVPEYNYLRALNGMVAYNTVDKKAWIAHQTQYQSHKPNQPTVLHPILMRYMLDKCANVDEAIALANQFNVKSVIPGSTYHILVSDKSGKTVLLEWQKDEMIVVDINHTTNFFVCREDKLGAGYERDECIEAGLKRYRKGMAEYYGEHLLAFVAQAPDNGTDRSKTQYSCVYNMNQASLKVFSFGDFTQSWTYKL